MSSNLHTFTLEHGWTELADKLCDRCNELGKLEEVD